MDDTRPGRPRGLGAAVLDLPRQGGLEPVPPRPAAIRDRGARVGRSIEHAGGQLIDHPGGRRGIDGRLRRAPAEHLPAPAPARGTTPRRASSLPAPAPTTFPDDWFMRRGEFERGALHDTAWEAELDVVTRWLDGQPLGGADRGAGRGHRLLLAADRRQGRAPRDRPRRRRARSRARPAARPSPARAPPRRGPVGRAARDRASPGRTPSSPRSCWAASAARASTPPRRPCSPASGPAAGWRRSSCCPTRPAARPTRSRGRGTPPASWRRRSGGRGSARSSAPRPGASSCSSRPRRAERRIAESSGRAFGAAGARCYPPARCPPSRTARSRPSAPASWPRR